MIRRTVAAALFAIAGVGGAQSDSPPGVAVLERMHRAYEGKWYQTLTFVQRTIVTRAGKTDTTTWYESLHGTRLRIDMGSPALGNGAMFTSDSTYVVRDGAVARAVASGNPFLPLIMGVYLKPADQTARELAAFGFDLSKVTTGSFGGRRVTIVGAASAADTSSAQFWVDDRSLVVRVLGALEGAAGMNIVLGGYERLGSAWLATKISMMGTNRSQTEEYSDWKANVPLDDALFDATKWKSARHWAPKTPQ